MGTTVEKLQKILNSKNAIKTVLKNKNVGITDSTKFSEYAPLINKLIKPSGKIEISNTNEIDVTKYSTAQVVDSNLASVNIAKDKVVLGLTGTYVTPIDGNATTGYVLSGYTFYSNNATSKQTGTMKNRGAVTGTISTSSGTYNIASGYHNGSGTVSIPSGSILIPPSGTSLNNFSWKAIQFLAQTNKLRSYVSVGSTKNITIGGTSVTATLIGFNHDSSNSATFIVTLPTTYKLFSSGSNTSGGWGSSTLRTTLNNTVLGTLNSDLQEVLISVTKKYNTAGGLNITTTRTSSDKLFIPSFKEISGNSYYYNNSSNLVSWTLDDGEQYEYFKNGANWYIDSRYLCRSIPQNQRVGFIEASENKKWIFWFNTTASVRMCFVVG